MPVVNQNCKNVFYNVFSSKLLLRISFSDYEKINIESSKRVRIGYDSPIVSYIAGINKVQCTVTLGFLLF